MNSDSLCLKLSKAHIGLQCSISSTVRCHRDIVMVKDSLNDLRPPHDT